MTPRLPDLTGDSRRGHAVLGAVLAALCLSTPVVPKLAAAPAPEESAGALPDVRARFFQQGKLRALVLSGRNNHDWRTTTPFLRSLLVDSGRFDVRVVEEPDGISARTARALRRRRVRLLRPALGRGHGAGARRLRPRRQGPGRRPRRGLRLLRPGRARRPPREDGHPRAGVEGARRAGRRLLAGAAGGAVPRGAPLVHGEARRSRAPGHEGLPRPLRRDRRALPPHDADAVGEGARHRVQRPRHGRHRPRRADPVGERAGPRPRLLHGARPRGRRDAERRLQGRAAAGRGVGRERRRHAAASTQARSGPAPTRCACSS